MELRIHRDTLPAGIAHGAARCRQNRRTLRQGRRHLPRAAPRHHRAGAGARRQTAGGFARRTVRRQPHHRAACAGATRRRRPGRTAPQPHRRGGDAELAGSARRLRYQDRTRAAGGAPARRQTDQSADRRSQRPCRRRGRRARRQRRGVDQARHRIPHPARQHDQQPDPGALCQRGRLSLLPDAVALQPPAFVANAPSPNIAPSSPHW